MGSTSQDRVPSVFSPIQTNSKKPVLYYDDVNPASRMCLMCLEFLDAPVERKSIDTLGARPISNSVESINFMYYVPTFVRGNLTLTSCHAILIYLCEQWHDGSTEDLLPPNFQLRMLVLNRLFFNDSIALRRHSDLMTSIIREGYNNIDHELQGRRISKLYELLEVYLNENIYMAGDVLTIADIAILATVESLDLYLPLQYSKEKFPKLCAWFKNMLKLPMHKATLKGLNRQKTILENYAQFKFADEKQSVPKRNSGKREVTDEERLVLQNSACKCLDGRSQKLLTEVKCKFNAPITKRPDEKSCKFSIEFNCGEDGSIPNEEIYLQDKKEQPARTSWSKTEPREKRNSATKTKVPQERLSVAKSESDKEVRTVKRIDRSERQKVLPTVVRRTEMQEQKLLKMNRVTNGNAPDRKMENNKSLPKRGTPPNESNGAEKKSALERNGTRNYTKNRTETMPGKKVKREIPVQEQNSDSLNSAESARRESDSSVEKSPTAGKTRKRKDYYQQTTLEERSVKIQSKLPKSHHQQNRSDSSLDNDIFETEFAALLNIASSVMFVHQSEESSSGGYRSEKPKSSAQIKNSRAGKSFAENAKERKPEKNNQLPKNQISERNGKRSSLNGQKPNKNFRNNHTDLDQTSVSSLNFENERGSKKESRPDKSSTKNDKETRKEIDVVSILSLNIDDMNGAEKKSKNLRKTRADVDQNNINPVSPNVENIRSDVDQDVISILSINIDDKNERNIKQKKAHEHFGKLWNDKESILSLYVDEMKETNNDSKSLEQERKMAKNKKKLQSDVDPDVISIVSVNLGNINGRENKSIPERKPNRMVQKVRDDQDVISILSLYADDMNETNNEYDTLEQERKLSRNKKKIRSDMDPDVVSIVSLNIGNQNGRGNKANPENKQRKPNRMVQKVRADIDQDGSEEALIVTVVSATPNMIDGSITDESSFADPPTPIKRTEKQQEKTNSKMNGNAKGKGNGKELENNYRMSRGGQNQTKSTSRKSAQKKDHASSTIIMAEYKSLTKMNAAQDEHGYQEEQVASEYTSIMMIHNSGDNSSNDDGIPSQASSEEAEESDVEPKPIVAKKQEEEDDDSDCNCTDKCVGCNLNIDISVGHLCSKMFSGNGTSDSDNLVKSCQKVDITFSTCTDDRRCKKSNYPSNKCCKKLIKKP